MDPAAAGEVREEKKKKQVGWEGEKGRRGIKYSRNTRFYLFMIQ